MAEKVQVKCACGENFVAYKNDEGKVNQTRCVVCRTKHVAEGRVNRLAHQIDLLANLKNYPLTEQQIANIESYIITKLSAALDGIKGKTVKTKAFSM